MSIKIKAVKGYIRRVKTKKGTIHKVIRPSIRKVRFGKRK